MIFKVDVYGKTCRTYTFDDVGKFRDYVRKKWKQGFDATRFSVYRKNIRSENSEFIWSLTLCEQWGGECQFEHSATPGYQEVRYDSYFRVNGGTVLFYHGATYARNGMKDVPGFSETIRTAREMVKLLDAQERAFPNNYKIRSTRKALMDYIVEFGY